MSATNKIKNTLGNPRAEKGLALASTVSNVGEIFAVDSSNGWVEVTPRGAIYSCQCEDHKRRGGACKHIWAVIFYLEAAKPEATYYNNAAEALGY